MQIKIRVESRKLVMQEDNLYTHNSNNNILHCMTELASWRTLLRNLETQVGQLAKQLADQQGGQFTASTETNLKEQCKAITIRSGKKVGFDVNEEAAESRDD